jgi:hypothetical protein
MLYHVSLRVPKNESSFVYFILESNEGICFYSTLKESLGTSYRDIAVSCHESTKDLVIDQLARLKESLSHMEILS